MLVDTHCHLADPAFAPDREAVVERMRAAGVGRALVIESNPGGARDTLAWARTAGGIGVATACHPHDAAGFTDEQASELAAAWADPLTLAVGEIGLDYHYDRSPRAVQRAVFERQLALAVAAGLPVIIHAREADADVVGALLNQPAAVVVLHSFSSGEILRDAALQHGWYLSFSGMITFRSWTQADTLRMITSDRMLIETDAPYLAPVPHRGTRNEPAFVVEVARALAQSRGASFEQVAADTTRNALRVFWGA